MSESINKPAKWYLIVLFIALLWNMLGISAFILQVTHSPVMFDGMPAEQLAFYDNIPLWADIAFGIAVFAGTLGCLGLLLRKRWAGLLLVLSMLGIVVQNFHAFMLGDAMAILGPASVAMPTMVAVVALLLIWLAGYAEKQQWLD